jgi:poly(A) polymerase
VCLLSLADLLAIYGHTLPDKTLERHLDVLRLLLDAWYEHHKEQVKPPALVDGNDLMKAFKLKPGPQIGELLEQIREAQVEGTVRTKGDAFELAEKTLANK